MSGPYQINASNDDEDPAEPYDVSQTVYSDNEETALDYASGTLEAYSDGWTVTVTDASENGE